MYIRTKWSPSFLITLYNIIYYLFVYELPCTPEENSLLSSQMMLVALRILSTHFADVCVMSAV
jgi:hypothetical protein